MAKKKKQKKILDYQVEAVRQEPWWRPNKRAHIVGVGTRTRTSGAHRYWTIEEVIDAMKHGETFYTQTGKKQAEVVRAKCHSKACGRWTIRSSPDATKGNNLNSLPRC